MKIFQVPKIVLQCCKWLIMSKLCSKISYSDRFSWKRQVGMKVVLSRLLPMPDPEFPWERGPEAYRCY